jgi:ATP-binding cassette subfamily B protein
LQPVLRRFNLAIPAGRIVAFVGPNGAGKSTFIKLLCRFYDPDEGAILWDGADLRAFRPEQLRGSITVLFQDPVRYNSTVAENIGGHAVAAAHPAGAADIIDALPNGYGTVLGKLFTDGVELSGGQWHRIALARAFARNAPLVILDEPTSAMDPWAEAEWFDRFRDCAAGRTAILITHRFTTAMRADVIHVVADGAVVESGSHSELIAAGGLYAQSWQEQTVCS